MRSDNSFERSENLIKQNMLNCDDIQFSCEFGKHNCNFSNVSSSVNENVWITLSKVTRKEW